MDKKCSKCGSQNVEETYAAPGTIVRPSDSGEPYASSSKVIKCLDCGNEDVDN
jgi:predicted nucleic-acid-binding Zn-ribbon protein